MKKVSVLLLVMFILFTLISCIEVPDIEEIDSIEIIGWQAREYYELTEPVDLSEARVRVNYTTSDPSTLLSLNSEGLTVSGTGNIKAGSVLDTDTLGNYFLRFSYGGISVSVNYSVVKHVLNPGDDIQDYINGGTSTVVAGDTVYLNAGNYYVSSTTTVDDISIIGPAYEDAYVTALSNLTTIFLIASTSDEATIMNLHLQTSHYPASYTAIINVHATDNTGIINIKNNVIRGLWPGNILFFTLQTAGIEIASGAKDPNLEIYIHDNTLFNLRTGISAYVSGISAFEVVGNNIFHTKGGLLFRSATLEFHTETAVIEDNTWTSTDTELFVSHNEWDIVYFRAGLERMTGTSVLEASTKNNDAYVLNRMNQTPVADVTHNRSHAFVVLAADLDDFKNHINQNAYRTSQTVNAYDSTPYTGNDLSTSANWYLDIGSGDTGDRGGNRDFYWKPAQTVDMAYEAIVYGGKIMVWTEVEGFWQFVEHDVDWDAWTNVNIPPY